MSQRAERVWYLYVVQCSDGTLYTGITVDVQRRVDQHNKGRGAAYTRSRRPVTLLAAWAFRGQRAAIQAERAFKHLNRQHKLSIIESAQSFHGTEQVSIDKFH